MQNNDEELIRRYKEGDIDAFKELYERYKIPLFNFILSIVKDIQLSEDIFQETFIKVIEKIYSYQTSNFKAYLYTVARNLAIDYLRKSHYKKEESLTISDKKDTYTDINDGNSNTDLLKNIEINKIRKAIDELDDIYREIIYLKHFSKLTFREISQITGQPIGTLLSRFKRGIEKLREKLKNDKTFQ